MNVRTILAAVLLLGLAACASLGFKSDLQKIEVACVTAAAAVKTLTVANGEGKLTEAQQRAIEGAITTAAPICGATEPPTLTDVQAQAFAAAIVVLQEQASRL